MAPSKQLPCNTHKEKGRRGRGGGGKGRGGKIEGRKERGSFWPVSLPLCATWQHPKCHVAASQQVTPPHKGEKGRGEGGGRGGKEEEGEGGKKRGESGGEKNIKRGGSRGGAFCPPPGGVRGNAP